jgi:hypothetical protein
MAGEGMIVRMLLLVVERRVGVVVVVAASFLMEGLVVRMSVEGSRVVRQNPAMRRMSLAAMAMMTTKTSAVKTSLSEATGHGIVANSNGPMPMLCESDRGRPSSPTAMMMAAMMMLTIPLLAMLLQSMLPPPREDLVSRAGIP